MTYTCPVCGYDRLDEPPKDWAICPCCGTQFNYSDSGRSHKALRDDWIKDGCKWRGRPEWRPPGWNAQEQLKNLTLARKP